MSNYYANFSFMYTWKQNFVQVTKEYYTRTGSGKSWRQKPYKTEIEMFDGIEYENYVRSIPWFNFRYSYTDKNSCRADWGYTWAGYIPTKVSTVSPSGNEKIIARFKFIDK